MAEKPEHHTWDNYTAKQCRDHSIGHYAADLHRLPFSSTHQMFDRQTPDHDSPDNILTAAQK